MKLVEKIARAMWDSLYSYESSAVECGRVVADNRWLMFRPQALAALKAMREPSEGMLRAMNDADGATFATVVGVYQRGIDAAISEAES